MELTITWSLLPIVPLGEAVSFERIRGAHGIFFVWINRSGRSMLGSLLHEAGQTWHIIIVITFIDFHKV
jgi:hypothetical protein